LTGEGKEGVTLENATTLVIGLGNPMLGDDGVGWRIAREVERRIQRPDIEVDCVALGGLSLMERMIGYSRVVLTDAVITRTRPTGSVLTLSLDDLVGGVATHSGSTHDVSLVTALEIGRTVGADLPEEIVIIGVETEPNFQFGETLSGAVEAAVPQAVEAVLRTLERSPGPD
jgi:hydrogenase maturation protease